MAAGAGALFAGLEADEAAHAAQFHAVLVEQLEVNGGVGGHLEMGAAIALDGDIAEDADGGPVDEVGAFFAVALATEVVVIGPADGFGEFGLRSPTTGW